MSSLYGLTFQLEEPTPNKPTKIINIMVDEEGEKYINYLHQQLQQKENIIKEVREYINHYETIRGYFEYEELGYDEYNYDEDLKQELLEILDKVDKEK